MTDEEKKEYEKISPMTEGQMSMKCRAMTQVLMVLGIDANLYKS